MKLRQPAPRHDQTAIFGARERRDGAFDLAGVAHIDRAHVHPKRRRRGLDGGDLRALIRRMSIENPLSSAPRIHGELLKLGRLWLRC
jgi:hypothetical protein